MENTEKTLSILIRLPIEVNKILRIEAIREGMTLKQYCEKVLSEYARGK